MKNWQMYAYLYGRHFLESLKWTLTMFMVTTLCYSGILLLGRHEGIWGYALLGAILVTTLTNAGFMMVSMLSMTSIYELYGPTGGRDNPERNKLERKMRRQRAAANIAGLLTIIIAVTISIIRY